MLTPVTMHKAEKYAVCKKSLTERQKTFFMKNFGCSRKVYNAYVDFYYHALEEQGYQNGDDIPEVRLPEVTEFKAEYPYLKEADSLGLANAKIDFENAVRRYREEYDHRTYTKRALRRAGSGTEALSFRGLKGIPKFHSRAQGYFSYKTNCQYPSESNKLTQPTIRLEGNMLHIPKLKESLELVIHRRLPEDAVIGNVTISMDTDGAIFASVEYSYTVMMDMTLREAAKADDASILGSLRFAGLDYSQQDFCVDSDGRKANAPHFYRKSEEKLARLQRQLSHMQKGSHNYSRQLEKIRKCSKKTRNQRKDMVNKESRFYADGYDVVCIEDIDLRAMSRSLKLGKNLMDNGFGMFRDALACKLEEKGSVLVKIDRWYPSSQVCSRCGSQNPELKDAAVREWYCPKCGAHHNRDINAAVNIREEGKRILLSYYRNWMEEDERSREKAAALKGERKRKKKAA